MEIKIKSEEIADELVKSDYLHTLKLIFALLDDSLH